jgi:hypothetical protein
VERTSAIVLLITFALAGSLNLWTWARNGDRLPRYVHAMALGAAVLGVALGLVDNAREDGGVLGSLLLVILPPTLVYLTFGVFGQHVIENRDTSDPSDGAA